MTRAIVIKSIGDADIANAIADGMTRAIPLESGELREVKAEYERLQARDAVRAYGDEKRWQETKEKLARTYAPKRHGRLYWAVLALWAWVWDEFSEWVDFLVKWNMEE